MRVMPLLAAVFALALLVLLPGVGCKKAPPPAPAGGETEELSPADFAMLCDDMADSAKRVQEALQSKDLEAVGHAARSISENAQDIIESENEAYALDDLRKVAECADKVANAADNNDAEAAAKAAEELQAALKTWREKAGVEAGGQPPAEEEGAEAEGEETPAEEQTEESAAGEEQAEQTSKEAEETPAEEQRAAGEETEEQPAGEGEAE